MDKAQEESVKKACCMIFCQEIWGWRNSEINQAKFHLRMSLYEQQTGEGHHFVLQKESIVEVELEEVETQSGPSGSICGQNRIPV